MHTIGIMVNLGKETALDIARQADFHLRSQGAVVHLQTRVAEEFGVPELGKSDDEVTDADAVVVLGGDGTILATSRLCAPKGVPMLPVHLGRFGFLTEVAPKHLTEALDVLLADGGVCHERMMLSGVACRHGMAQDEAPLLALNDIVLANGPLSRVLHLGLSINGNFVTTFAADGIIVATPTGSTGYSLSAGGPLVHPELQTLVVTPICPHTLTARALLTPADSEVTLRVDRDAHDIVRVTVDGQLGFPLKPRDEVVIRRAPYRARIINVGGPGFYDKLQTKLRWGDSALD